MRAAIASGARASPSCTGGIGAATATKTALDAGTSGGGMAATDIARSSPPSSIASRTICVTATALSSATEAPAIYP